MTIHRTTNVVFGLHQKTAVVSAILFFYPQPRLIIMKKKSNTLDNLETDTFMFLVANKHKKNEWMK